MMEETRPGLIRAGSVSGERGETSATVTLAHDARHRRRGVLRTDAGEEFLLDLPEAIELRDGDALRLEDGRLVAVRAALEPLVEVRGQSPLHLTRLAWHLGNRHVPVEIGDGHLLVKRDHVLEAMLAGLGARLAQIEAPFSPEGGAYAHGHAPAATSEAPPHRHG